ncbi:hypothetical protein GVX82_04025 [Patescibacteria group bacterium]|jgi:hypothetical protein|nr:hypothetical protein [Patescibacteria group bacterium]
MIHTHISRALRESIAATLIVAVAALGLYLAWEPIVGSSATSQFEVQMTIDDEIVFATAPAGVNIGSLFGLTGGTTTGRTQIVVQTNNSTGYNLRIAASSSGDMVGNATASTVPAYGPDVAGVPDYFLKVPAGEYEFGYTANASGSASDLAQEFRNSGTSCNSGSSQDIDRCWLNATSGDTVFVQASDVPPNTYGTSTLTFQVTMNGAPSDPLPSDTYVATMTVTALNNP